MKSKEEKEKSKKEKEKNKLMKEKIESPVAKKKKMSRFSRKTIESILPLTFHVVQIIFSAVVNNIFVSENKKERKGESERNDNSSENSKRKENQKN